MDKQVYCVYNCFHDKHDTVVSHTPKPFTLGRVPKLSGVGRAGADVCWLYWCVEVGPCELNTRVGDANRRSFGPIDRGGSKSGDVRSRSAAGTSCPL